MLQKITDQIWTAAIPLKMLGLRVGTRMTVVKLSNNTVLLHSPIPITDELRRELDALGPVSHIICPNLYHHLYAKEAAETFPDATLHGPEALHKKRAELRFGGGLSGAAHPDWAADLSQLKIEGCMLQETVFFHAKTKTLISADLAENMITSDHWPTRLYIKAGGAYGSRLSRLIYRDKAKAKQSVSQLFNWDFEKVIISHGDLITEQAREAITQTFSWL